MKKPMSTPIITVDGLGKAYRLGLKEEKYPTFRDALVGAAAGPWRRFRRLSDRRSSDEELFWALKDVSFEVNRGEVVGIIGRNGAGKSTLLKILSRIVEPTAGRAVLRGRVASLLEVGTGFHPELTGRENIYLNGSILGMTKREIDRKFDEIVAFAEVEKFLDTPVKRYSSGMYVRLAFAVAAHLEPEILIVDEVLAVGDAEFQKKCLGKMQEVARGGGRTVLFVSHNMAAVESLCSSCLYLQGGMVSTQGPTAATLQTYYASIQRNCSPEFHFDDCHLEQDAYLRAAYILSSTGIRSNALNFGEPFQIHLEWENRRHLANVSYSIQVYDRKDSVIFASNTIAHALEIEAVGTHSLTCLFPVNVLVPGNYRIAVSAWIRGRGSVAAYEDCLSLVVTEVPHTDAKPYTIACCPAVAAPFDWKRTSLSL